MSFLHRFFSKSTEPIEVILPSDAQKSPWARRFLLTIIAATAVAVSAPWMTDKLDIIKIAQKMQSISGQPLSLSEVSAAKDALTFYDKLLSNGNGPGELRIEVTDQSRSALLNQPESKNFSSTPEDEHTFRIFQKSAFVSDGADGASSVKDILMPNLCVLKISLSDVEGLARLAHADPKQMDVRHSANGFGRDIYLAGELLASRTQCLLESQTDDFKERTKMGDYINAASSAHATLLIGQQIGLSAAYSFSATLEKLYGEDSTLFSGASRAAKLLSSGTLRLNANTRPLMTLGLAMKLAKHNSENPREPPRINDEDYTTMIHKVTAVSSHGKFPHSEAVFNIDGKSLAWHSGSIQRGPAMGALHTRLAFDSKNKIQTTEEKTIGIGL